MTFTIRVGDARMTLSPWKWPNSAAKQGDTLLN
jgi:hypothetical protein